MVYRSIDWQLTDDAISTYATKEYMKIILAKKISTDDAISTP